MKIPTSIVTYLLFINVGLSIRVSKIPKSGTPPTRRQFHAYGYSTTNNSVYIYGGYESIEFFEDMWSYNLSQNEWEEIHSPSVITPGPRIGAYIHILEDENKILLYGGKNKQGPLSDLWIFDIESHMVTSSSVAAYIL